MGCNASLSAPSALGGTGPGPGGIQIVLTVGPESADRAALAFDLALAAVTSGQPVAMFLSLEATAWVCAEDDVLPDAFRRRLDELIRFGVPVSCCAPCASARCGGSTQVRVRDGVALVGLATLVEAIAGGARTVTF